MKYSVIDSRCTPPRVKLTFPFQWMAEAVAGSYGGEKAGFDVAITPTDPQEIIKICHHRDKLQEALNFSNQVHGDLLCVLFGLVARGDSGKWGTVHGADEELPEEAQRVLSQVFG